MEIINEKYNGVRIVKNELGKFGLQEIIDGIAQEPTYRYRTIEMAEKTAQAISDENDRLDAYENAHR